MALDPNRWTLKTQEALNHAVETARANANPEVTPDHLLVALLGQEEGIVLPILSKVGQAPMAVRADAQAAVDRLPKAYGSDARMSRDLTALLDAADATRRELHDEYLSTEHLLLAFADRLGVSHEDLLAALAQVQGQPPRDEPEPRRAVPGAREVRARPHRGGAGRPDRSGHRA